MVPPNLRRGLPLALLVLLVGSQEVGAGDGDAPAVVGDVERLACRLVKVEAVSRELDASIVTLEVRNTGSVAAEPLRFELRVKARGAGGAGQPRSLRRMPDPVHGRAGRVVEPGGTQSYLLPVALASRALAGASLRVVSASFPSGPGIAQPPLELGRLTTQRVPDEGGYPVWETSVEVRNTLDVPVDGVFLAKCEEPQATRVLVRRRLLGGERVTWTLREASLEPDAPGAAYITGLAVKQLTLVDWSVVRETGEAEGRALLAAAWARWARWEPLPPGVRGRFRVSLAGPSAPPVDQVQGRLRVSAEGTVTCWPEPAVGPEVSRLLQRTVTDAFADLRRPSVTAVLPGLAPTLVERTAGGARVQCAQPLVGGPGPAEVHSVQDGVLRGWESVEGGSSIREVWATEPRGGGYVVTSRELFQAGIGGGRRATDARHWTYGELGGRIVPLRYARAEWYVGDRAEEVVVEFSNLTFDETEPTAEKPQAPAEVRAAWDVAYRYPQTTVTLRARFRADNPGTSALWRGVRVVEGTLSLQGFVGMGGPGRPWTHADIHVDGPHSDDLVRDLAALVEDRLRIWAHRDFGGRGDFDVAFRGAVVTPRNEAPGVYDVENGPCTQLTVRHGRIVAWDPASLLAGTLEYTDVKGTPVHTGLRSGEALSRVRVVDVGGGWVVPTHMTFERTLGPEWGPETVVLEDVRLEPEPVR